MTHCELCAIYQESTGRKPLYLKSFNSEFVGGFTDDFKRWRKEHFPEGESVSNIRANEQVQAPIKGIKNFPGKVEVFENIFNPYQGKYNKLAFEYGAERAYDYIKKQIEKA